MAPRVKKVLKFAGLGLAIGAVSVLAGLLPLNLFFVKSAISEAVQTASGLRLELQGPVRLRLGPRPSLTASEIALLRPGGNTVAVKLEQVKAVSRLGFLLRGEWRLKGLRLTGLELDFCELATLPAVSGESGGTGALPEFPAIDELQLEFRSGCSIAEDYPPYLPDEGSLRAKLPYEGAAQWVVDGRSAGEDWRLDLTTGNLNHLPIGPESWPVNAAVTLLSSRLDFVGELADPLGQPGLAGDVALEIPRVEHLSSWLALDTAVSGPLRLDGRLAANAEAFGIEDLSGSWNGLEFAGSVQWSTAKKRPRLDFDLALGVFDPAILENSPASPGEAMAESFDLRPLMDGLAAFDGRFRLHVDQIRNRAVNLQDLTLAGALDQGTLDLESFRAEIEGIPVQAQASWNTGAPCPTLESSLAFDMADFSALNRLIGDDIHLQGQLTRGEINTSSCGADVAAHHDSLEATVSLEGLEAALGPDSPVWAIEQANLSGGWREPGLASLNGLRGDSPIALEIAFGSVEAMTSGATWPMRLELDTPDLEFDTSGQLRLTADQLAGSWTFDGRFGNSDLRGDIDWPGAYSGNTARFELKAKNLDIGELVEAFSEPTGRADKAATNWQEVLKSSDWLEQQLSLPSIDFTIRADRIAGLRREAHNVLLEARLDDRVIEDGRLELMLQDFSLRGTLNADLTARPWRVNYDSKLDRIDIGKALDSFGLAAGVDARAREASLSYRSQGDNLEEVLLQSELNVAFVDIRWNFTLGPEDLPFDLRLDTLDFSTRPGQGTTWESHGTLNEVPAHAFLQAPDLATMLDRSKSFPFTLALQTGRDINLVQADLQRSRAGERRMTFSWSGALAGEQDVDLRTLRPPLPEFEFGSSLVIGDARLDFQNLQAVIGESRASGRVGLVYENPGYFIDIELDSPYIETDDLVLWAEDWRNSRERITGRKDTATAETQTGDEEISGGVFDLINQWFDDITGSNRIHGKLQVDRLFSSGELLGHLDLALRFEDGDLLIEPATLKLPGANVDVRYNSSRAGEGFLADLDLHVEKLDYGGLLRLLDPESTAQGTVHLDVKLDAQSPTPGSAAKHLNGILDIALFPENIGAHFLDLWATNLVFALLPAAESGEKKMNCLVGRFRVENGLMIPDTLFLDTTDIIVRARGDIDLGNRELDLWVGPQAKRERFLSISTPLEVKGSFDDFEVGMVPGGFITTMIRWYYNLIYVPWKWLTGERFPADGLETCYVAMDWPWPPEEGAAPP